MSVDLSAPEIANAYEQVRGKQLDWLLLTYAQTRDKLFLLASGVGGIDALVQALPDNDVFYGFCREEEKERSYFCLISYVPESVPPVRKARALVHSRAVAANFKAHHATMSVNKKTDISKQTVRSKLKLDALPRQRNLTQFDAPSNPELAIQPSRIPIRAESLNNGFHPRSATDIPTPRSVSDTHLRTATSAGPASPRDSPATTPRVMSPTQTSGSRRLSPVEPQMYSPLSSRSRSPVPPMLPSKDVVAYDDVDDLYAAPPPPPKDATVQQSPTGSFVYIPGAGYPGHNPDDMEPPSPSATIPTIPDDIHSYYRGSSYASNAPAGLRSSAYTEASHYSQSTMMHDPPPPMPRSGSLGRIPSMPVLPRGVSLPRKSLEERQREIEEKRDRERRETAELQRQEEEEAERRRQVKLAEQRREEEEENKKRRHEEQERRRWVAERQRKAELRRLEEERQRQEEEARKATERVRRVEEARKAQKQREADGRAAEAARRMEEKERQLHEKEQTDRLKTIAKQFIAEAGGADVALSGECTVQTSWTTVWRRRYFELNNETMTFYKHEADPQPLDVLRIKGRVGRIATWRDGHDEIMSIPHSFAVEFKDDESPWFFYTDSEEAKEVLVGLLSKACGLI
ncbi:hypothetical protein BKA62DRAFT_826394 [Auriculariales sp. MPI-PUGE-AT-0066]|nr:hypothetical protein BKA62DRAFT_826394 [Auriculariales sp. MPI-PUGE-AT-0066]